MSTATTSLADRPARLVAEHPRTYDFAHAFQTVSRLAWDDAMRLLRESDGTVADALASDNSFLDPADIDGYIDEACQFWERGLDKVVGLRQDELARAKADLETWRAFSGGDEDE